MPRSVGTVQNAFPTHAARTWRARPKDARLVQSKHRQAYNCQAYQDSVLLRTDNVRDWYDVAPQEVAQSGELGGAIRLMEQAVSYQTEVCEADVADHIRYLELAREPARSIEAQGRDEHCD